RVEVACPVYSSELIAMLSDYLNRLLSDNVKARRLQSNGSYLPVPKNGDAAVNAQSYYMENPIILTPSVHARPSLRTRLRRAVRFGQNEKARQSAERQH